MWNEVGGESVVGDEWNDGNYERQWLSHFGLEETELLRKYTKECVCVCVCPRAADRWP